jgi:phosphatidylglycerophosphate synthase
MLANLLTTLRLLLIVPLVWVLAGAAGPDWLLLMIVVAAIASDYFDGKIARSRGTASARGMLFDHGSDFLFVSAGLFAAASIHALTVLLPLLIVFAFSQYVLDSYFLFRQKQLRMNFLGRWNGVFYFSPLLLIALARLFGDPVWLGELIYWLAIALCLSTVASIIDRSLAPRKLAG